jgi:APA family basic amino acid/polyamine antiporter
MARTLHTIGAAPRTPSPHIDLARVLGPWAAAAIVVGTMLGTGIFIVPSTMARQAGSVPLVMTAWVLGGLLALFGALSYAELAAAMPDAGGQYVYLRRAFSSGGPMLCSSARARARRSRPVSCSLPSS